MSQSKKLRAELALEARTIYERQLAAKKEAEENYLPQLGYGESDDDEDCGGVKIPLTTKSQKQVTTSTNSHQIATPNCNTMPDEHFLKRNHHLCRHNKKEFHLKSSRSWEDRERLRSHCRYGSCSRNNRSPSRSSRHHTNPSAKIVKKIDKNRAKLDDDVKMSIKSSSDSLKFRSSNRRDNQRENGSRSRSRSRSRHSNSSRHHRDSTSSSSYSKRREADENRGRSRSVHRSSNRREENSRY